ncbi:HEAT repeat domain-containing protein [Streptomyces lunaelactis]|uniref:HEAT repeat domain-containing protein n=1 Tax=Streptomyces lunaelactis TaxID=1535768 RepID=UPI001585AFED|nr:HEAT repeat domain-containing protein [Streptomyces lunaelactis]NUK09996.1 HEAT repeat domain-containing protein [Streptomyces lunaelactis]NUK36086.1 HEAT repeat domain-containing protein [Streptomyces lunaelactis]NUK58895.1 HEAT repeat domain-containing protein [Streptomyces lunaelactis]NUK73727.1 HEAT repeat domain-containing protein [Streptomyces lunaelactis]NUK78305.1 HEAT repeat domain-containing protein [Streptomyces lunaelactis]
MAFAVTVALYASLVLILFCVLILLVCRMVRNRLDRLHSQRVKELRPLVLASAVSEDDEALEQLVQLDRRSWRMVEPSVLSLLSQLQGEAHEALTAVLVRRGLVDRALEDLGRRGRVRRARAAGVLALTGPTLRHDPVVGPRARQALETLLDDADPTVRAAVVRALGRFGDEAGARALLAHLSGRRQVASGLVSHALVRIAFPAVPGLLEAARSDDVQIRALALELLSLIGDRAAVPQLLEALRDDQGVVRASAAQALGQMGEHSAVDPLLTMLSTDSSPRVAAAAAEALGAIGDRRAIGSLASAVGRPHFRSAHAAAQSLLRLGPQGEETLRQLVRDEPTAEAHASEALAQLSLRQSAGRTTS